LVVWKKKVGKKQKNSALAIKTISEKSPIFTSHKSNKNAMVIAKKNSIN